MIDVPLDQSKLAVVGGRHPIGGEGSGGRAQAGSAALPAVPPATRGRWRHSGVPARWQRDRATAGPSPPLPPRRQPTQPRRSPPLSSCCLGGRRRLQNGRRAGRRGGPAEAVEDPPGLAGTCQHRPGAEGGEPRGVPGMGRSEPRHSGRGRGALGPSRPRPRGMERCPRAAGTGVEAASWPRR